MSQVTICDICGEVVGHVGTRVVVAGQTHPHSMERIRESEDVDACINCLRHIPDLTTPHDLESLQRRERSRRSITAS
jgi:hypothetical protein